MSKSFIYFVAFVVSVLIVQGVRLGRSLLGALYLKAFRHVPGTRIMV